MEYHTFKEKPLTNDKMKEYFPEYTFKKTKTIEKPKQKTVKELIKEDSKEVKNFVQEFLSLPGRDKIRKIDEVLRFTIAGENKTRLLLYFLLLMKM